MDVEWEHVRNYIPIGTTGRPPKYHHKERDLVECFLIKFDILEELLFAMIG